MEDKKQEILDATVLPRAEQRGGGDADSEALAALQDALERYCDESCETLRKKFLDKMNTFET
jgi:hypothetical protein